MSTSTDPRVAFVQSSWHGSIVDRGRTSFVEEIVELGVCLDRVEFSGYQGHLNFHSTSSDLRRREDTRPLLPRDWLWTVGFTVTSSWQRLW